ncbi:leucine-rich repeat protein [Butyrivibrio sp. AD3002]|uniref:leucine-rich repeat protein n=1 Tax=Butyrivibrio sp. AD3002 TaxID=1280670 RepID=UPI0003B6F25F|nr:leucine-rich repeat protein [Butyrivibrio sp. AD3002]
MKRKKHLLVITVILCLFFNAFAGITSRAESELLTGEELSPEATFSAEDEVSAGNAEETQQESSEEPNPGADNPSESESGETRIEENADSIPDDTGGSAEDPEAGIEMLLPVETEELTALGSAFSSEYDSLNDLLAADIPVGTVVSVKGYASAGDGGAASYQITDSAPDKNIFYTKMKNKKYAQLILTDTINVAQVGIFPTTDISERLNLLITSSVASGVVSTIQFNDGVYTLDKTIYLKSLNYKGTGNTTLSVSKSYRSGSNRIMYTVPGETSPTFSLTFSDINFYMETTKDHPLKDKQVVILSLSEIDGCKITNCNFYAAPAKKNGGFMQVDLVWFKHSRKLNNVEVSNCSFRNLTGMGYEGNITDTLVGGCLWFCGKENTLDSTLENLSVHDCDFETTLTDEILAFWRGNYRNVSVYNCNFKNHTHDCHNIFTLFNGSFKDTSIKNCTFNLSAACVRVCKVMRLAGETEVVFDGITFDLDSGVTDTKRNSSIFFTGPDSEETTGEYPANVTVKNCITNSKNGTVYRTFLDVPETSLKTYNVSDCTLEMPFTTGVLSMKKGKKNTVNISSCVINTNDYLTSLTQTEACRVSFCNNTIKNKINAGIYNSASLFYKFSGNTCTYAEKGTVLSCKNLSKEDFVVLYNEGNNYPSGTKINEFYINNKLKADDIVVRTQDPDGAEFYTLTNTKPEDFVAPNTNQPAPSEDPANQATPEDPATQTAPEDNGSGQTSSAQVNSEPAQPSEFTVTVDDITYTIGSDGNATVDKIGKRKKASLNNVTVDGITYPVTKIAAKACKGNDTIKKVVIGKNVRSIGKNAFKGCSNLKKITIKANKHLKIGAGAFKKLPEDSKIKIKGVSGKTKSRITKAVAKRTNAEVE